MAGAILIHRSGPNFSSSTSFYRAVVLAFTEAVADDDRFTDTVSVALDVGALSVMDRDDALTSDFLNIMEEVARRIARRVEPVSGWGYPHEMWQSIRDHVPEFLAFIQEARRAHG